MIDPHAFRAALGAVCTPVAVVTSALDGRPHVIVVGRVEHAEHEARLPLLHQQRTFCTLAAA
jgi:flavin reductase (DIM6/NTAB) family NADH-FMN oxidoreductase RutF